MNLLPVRRLVVVSLVVVKAAVPLLQNTSPLCRTFFKYLLLMWSATWTLHVDYQVELIRIQVHYFLQLWLLLKAFRLQCPKADPVNFPGVVWLRSHVLSLLVT